MAKLIRLLFLTISIILPLLATAQLGSTDLSNCHKEFVEAETGELTIEFKGYLKDALSGVQIIALGESTHEDGATFEHKVKLVKFLHQELGFNVLAFEYAFYGNWMANQAFIEEADDSTATQYAGWIKSKEAAPVYDYIASTHKSDTPLNYAGFDSEKLPLGIPHTRTLIFSVADQVGYEIRMQDSLVVDSLIRAVEGKIGNKMLDAIGYKSRNQAKSVVHDLLQLINDKKGVLQQKWGSEQYQMYNLTLQSFLMSEKAAFAGGFKNIVRDKHMAQRMQWLVDSIYPDEKIILWGASGHFARNMVKIDRVVKEGSYGYYPYYQIGDWLAAWYGEAYYSVAFVAGSGKTGTKFPPDHKYKKYEQFYEINPDPSSFEGAAFHTGANTLFCNLRGVDNQDPMSKQFTAYPFGYEEDYAPWSEIIDAFYFIREMKPDELVE